MRSRLTLLISWGVNVVLAVIVLVSQHIPAPRPPPLRPISLPTKYASTNKARPYVFVQHQAFSWKELESDDYQTYITRLRAIGCPEATIRDIIVADVNQLYARKRATEVITNDQQWWRSEPDLQILEESANKSEALEAERRALLTKLLGPNWDTDEAALSRKAFPLLLNGPILGNLPPETKLAVQQTSAEGASRQQAYLDACNKEGKNPDPAVLAQLRMKTREDLARVLSPEQLQEYLLRYSKTAADMRAEFNGFEVTPDEFRSIFRQRDAIDLQIAQFYSGNDPGSVKQRELLEKQRDSIYDQALTPDRAKQFRLQQDPLYVQARSQIEDLGAAPEKVMPVYQINQATEEELARIKKDDTLSDEEREAALKSVKNDQEKALEILLGEEVFSRYKKDKKAPE